ncbi:phosphatidylethanolamine-binding protein [Colletotrichum truncatum]|uniref:Phosphatidylethanolamine-binding protein n=1 Tax=Colletotrichum truncatum TaxID=5467 RepID=A0ACC3ZHR1_COLTU|nr:phosphatidylethanolamine-binding protein [Colletotrichum truncatum]KAF6790631.1 phosphatidylethanolamine-binding protein [Colletotrichum truncatum]
MKTFRFALLALFTTAAWGSLLEKKQFECPTPSFSPRSIAEVRYAFQSHGLTPAHLPAIHPTIELRVKYGDKLETLGNEFAAIQTLRSPEISFDPEPRYDPATTKYTYIQVDPDTPGPALPVRRKFLHHLVYDLQPSCITTQAPVTQVDYQSLLPLSFTPHRYMSLLYRQPENYTPPPVGTGDSVVRVPFDLAAYVAQGGLQLVAGNFNRVALGRTVCDVDPVC